MAYFDAQRGNRPQEQPDAVPAPQASSGAPRSYFAITPGIAPEKPVAHRNTYQPAAAPPADRHACCPLCHGALLLKAGLHCCTGRCGARWLEEDGRLLDVAALPYGACACCTPAQALTRGERGAICPASRREYVLLPNGPAPIELAAPYGLCQCCVPPAPLELRGDVLICMARPANHYTRAGALVLPEIEPTRTQEEILAAIDLALRRNTARLTVNGLFDFD